MTPINNKTSLFSLRLNGPSEADITSFISILNKHIKNKHCLDAMLSLICQYSYPPCDISSHNVNYVSETQCSNIRDKICSSEWYLIAKLYPSAEYLLPSCEDFNGESDTAVESQPLQCHQQFKDFCGSCLPLCGKFSQFKAQTKLQEKSVLIFASIMAFFGGVLVFISSVCRRRKM